MKTLIACAALLASATPAAAVLVNFDAATGPIGATYAGLGVTFTNGEASPTFVAGYSAPNILVSDCCFTIFGAGDAIIATFSADVASLSITALDVGVAGARIEAYDAGAALVDFDEAFGPGVGVGNFLTLSVAGAGIRELRLFQPAPGGGDGLAFDDLEFTFAPVPAPAALGLFGLGLVALGARRRG